MPIRMKFTHELQHCYMDSRDSTQQRVIKLQITELVPVTRRIPSQ